MNQNKKILSFILSLSLVLSVFSPLSSVTAATTGSFNMGSVSEAAKQGFKNLINNTASQFVIVRHKQLGASDYAYTEALSDSRGLNQPNGDEYSFNPNSEMVLVSFDQDAQNKTEDILLESTSGVIRDPDVSADGTRVLFSWKQNSNDDFHLYEMTLATKEYKQLTFGQGISDMEGKYLPSGKIVFSSSRIVQTIDCWKTPVSNIYTCDADGKNPVRLGYDQVHTTYPTLTSDGRILYTRWDYNDRTQIFPQAVFQMFPDGTNQTELFGNNSKFPTTLLHTSEIPGATGKYFSIASGHHVWQTGKLCMIDTNIDRNEIKGKTDYAFSFVDQANSKAAYPVNGEDQYGVGGGYTYKYPLGISENELICSVNRDSNYFAKQRDEGDTGKMRGTPYGIYYMYLKSDGSTEYIEIESANKTKNIGASQCVMVPKTTKSMFERPSMVNFAKNTGTFYVGNVYEGEAVQNLIKPEYNPDGTVKTPGEVKQLRVVKIDYRSSAIGVTSAGSVDGASSNPYTPIATGNGSWDVKQVLGVVDVEADGSALFSVPSEVPVYFQLLNDKGEMLQTMRSWSTLMPNETFSCVGCHENKNSTPPSSASPTLAMQKGVQELKNESWMEQDGNDYEGYDAYKDQPIGFSYMNQVQTILDKNCASCHTDTQSAYSRIGYKPSSVDENLFIERSEWDYTTSAPTGSTVYKKDHAPFGKLGTEPQSLNTVVETDTVYLKKTFKVNNYQLNSSYSFFLTAINTGTAKIKINGTLDQTITETSTTGRDYTLNKANLQIGTNTIEVELTKNSTGMYFDAKLHATDPSQTSIVKIPQRATGWKYYDGIPTGNWYEKNFSDTTWSTGTAPFGGDWGTTKYNSNDVVVRKTFNLTSAELTNRDLVMDIKYDENPRVYINGSLVYSTTGWNDGSYKRVDLSAFNNLLVEGENVIAVTVTNINGGKGIDLSLNLSPKPSGNNAASTAILATGSTWKYTTSAPASNWNTEGFNDSSWNSGSKFGTNTGKETTWNTSSIWMRTTFNITDLNAVLNSTINLSIYYDESPTVYVNGTQIYTANGYNTGYTFKNVTSAIKNLLKSGTNTIAISASQTDGGQYIDAGIYTIPKSDYAVSFTSELLKNNPTKRLWPVSYLLLTGTTYGADSEFRGSGAPDDTNDFTNFLSSMSGVALQPDKTYGSSKSTIVNMLADDHCSTITDDEIRTIRAWIDLGVPLCGTYDELNNWGGNEIREFEEKANKRAYYEDMNKASRANLAKTAENNGELTISYNSKAQILGTAKGTGTVELVINSNDGLEVGDQVIIKLPEGQKYVAFRLDPRFEESLIYCPSGTFTYILPNQFWKVFPIVLSPKKNEPNEPPNDLQFLKITMSARIPSASELKKTRNISANPYDVTSGHTAYPHVTTSTNTNNAAEFSGRCAIDGFTTNKGHGTYPYQSWGPNLDANQWFKVDFGRSVKVDKLVVYTRADFPHDVSYTSGTLEFSDGTTKDVNFYKTSDGIEFNLDTPVNTTYVKIKDLVKANSNPNDSWAGFTEVKVFGSENDPSTPTVTTPATGVTLNKDTIANMKYGETFPLTATVAPANASDKSIVWSSSDYTVASVDANGNVTATGNGTATITATTHNGKTATCTVTGLNAVTSISITRSGAITNKKTGETVTLFANISPAYAANKDVTWKSNNTDVAVVNNNGLVTCLSIGSAAITATSVADPTKTATVTITVTSGAPYLTGIAINPATTSVFAGSTTGLKVVFTPSAASETITWTSSDNSIATVSSTGVVKGIKAGTVTITASSESGKTATSVVTVKPLTRVTSITLKSYTLTVGGSKTLTPTIKPSNATNKGVTWSSSKTSIATVNSSGKVTAKSAGKVTITAKAKDGSGKIGTATITVNPKAVTNVKAKKATSTSVKVSFKKTFTATNYEIWVKIGKKWVKKADTKSSSVVIKKLAKKKTYYFKVVSYKKVSGKKYYSVDSKQAKLKLK